jgi:putative acetyltransferase
MYFFASSSVGRFSHEWRTPVATSLPNAKPAVRPAEAADTSLADLTIRAREPGDYEQIAALMNLPNVRWGTLQLPFTSKEQWRKKSESPPDEMTCIVAEIGGRLVGIAAVTKDKGRRCHVGDIGLSVHDDFCRRGEAGLELMTMRRSEALGK